MAAKSQPQSARAQEASLRAKHDQTYKAFYAIVQTLQGLLYGYVPDLLKGAEKWFESFDFENAELLPTEHITPDLTRRYIDMLWRVPIVKGGQAGKYLYVVVLLEFQSRVDRFMALRVQSAALRVYEYLRKHQRPKRSRWVVPILPIVVYNGKARWTAPTRMRDLVQPITRPKAGAGDGEPAFTGDSYVVLDVGRYAGRELPANNIVSLMIRAETMNGLVEAGKVLDVALGQLETPQLEGLRQHFLLWFYLMLGRQGVDCKELLDEERMRSMAKAGKIRSFLDARVQEANSKLKAEGLEKGLEKGLEQGLEQGLEKGLEQGLEQGLEKGLERERELLQGQAKRRFGAETADRLAACLAEIREHDRMMAIGSWLVDCASGAELLDRVEGRV